MDPYLFSSATLLVVDDDANDMELILTGLRESGVRNNIITVQDGRDALEYLQGRNEYADRQRFPYPALVITDLKMPNGDGFAVLDYLRQDPDFKIVPVLVLSSSNDDDDVKRAYRMGATSYIRKPNRFSDLKNVLSAFYQYWRLCELPRVDPLGRQLATRHEGKLGERYGAMKSSVL